MVSILVFAPLILPPSDRFEEPFCHWYTKGSVPAAVTENTALEPATTERLDGCWVIVGAVGRVS
jgi:hypothetical protein